MPDRLETFARVSGIGSFAASFVPWTLIPIAYLARRWGGPPLVDATVATIVTIGAASYLLAVGSGVMFVRREAVRHDRRGMGPLRWAFAAKLNLTLQTSLMFILIQSGWLPR